MYINESFSSIMNLIFPENNSTMILLDYQKLINYHIAKYPFCVWHKCSKHICLYKMFETKRDPWNEIEKKLLLYFCSDFEVVMLLKSNQFHAMTSHLCKCKN